MTYSEMSASFNLCLREIFLGYRKHHLYVNKWFLGDFVQLQRDQKRDGKVFVALVIPLSYAIL